MPTSITYNPLNSTETTLLHLLSTHPRIKLTQAILFGSVAKGTAGHDSDLDLAIDIGTVLSMEDKIELIDNLAETFGRPVDLIDLRTVGEPLLGQILRTGKRLLGTNTDFGALVYRHVIDQADFVPYIDRILKERREAWLGKE